MLCNKRKFKYKSIVFIEKQKENLKMRSLIYVNESMETSFYFGILEEQKVKVTYDLYVIPIPDETSKLKKHIVATIKTVEMLINDDSINIVRNLSDEIINQIKQKIYDQPMDSY